MLPESLKKQLDKLMERRKAHALSDRQSEGKRGGVYQEPDEGSKAPSDDDFDLNDEDDAGDDSDESYNGKGGASKKKLSKMAQKRLAKVNKKRQSTV